MDKERLSKGRNGLLTALLLAGALAGLQPVAADTCTPPVPDPQGEPGEPVCPPEPELCDPTGGATALDAPECPTPPPPCPPDDLAIEPPEECTQTPDMDPCDGPEDPCGPPCDFEADGGCVPCEDGCGPPCDANGPDGCVNDPPTDPCESSAVPCDDEEDEDDGCEDSDGACGGVPEPPCPGGQADGNDEGIPGQNAVNLNEEALSPAVEGGAPVCLPDPPQTGPCPYDAIDCVAYLANEAEGPCSDRHKVGTYMGLGDNWATLYVEKVGSSHNYYVSWNLDSQTSSVGIDWWVFATGISWVQDGLQNRLALWMDQANECQPVGHTSCTVPVSSVLWGVHGGAAGMSGSVTHEVSIWVEFSTESQAEVHVGLMDAGASGSTTVSFALGGSYTYTDGTVFDSETMMHSSNRPLSDHPLNQPPASGCTIGQA